MKRLVYIFVLVGLVTSGNLKAQSLTGTRGLIKAPTARMYEDGTLAIGMGYVPAKFFKRTFNHSYDNSKKFVGYHTGNPGINTFITINITSFMEVMFRYSHELNLEISPQTTYFPDRMFTARFNLFKEKINRPAITLGLQDISALADFTCDICSNFTATYLVASKYIKYKNFKLDLSVGYAADLISLPAKDFKGFFGGIELQYDEFDKVQLLIDYDTTSLNTGIQGYLFNRFHTVLGLMDFEPMFIIAYRYKI